MTNLSRRRFLHTVAACAATGLILGPSGATAAPGGADPAPWAARRFLAHWNCAQAVVEAFAANYGLDPATAAKMATAFAGGMCRGGTCGAFTGAYMVIGLARGREGAPSDEVAGRVSEFSADMLRRFGSLDCSALLGEDMTTAEGVKRAAERGLFKDFCPRLVEAAVRKLQALL